MADPAVGVEERGHGTGSAYKGGCRCPACQNFNTRRCAAKRKRARERDPRIAARRAAQEAAEARARTEVLVQPVAGARFRRAAALSVEGDTRRRLLCLLAAYADAGEASPPIRVLLLRLGLTNAAQIDALLRSLERDGLLHVRWGDSERHERNTYELRLGAPV
jgi:hypothetical protein